jgi:DNA-binding CsgD family transcriptional regulator
MTSQPIALRGPARLASPETRFEAVYELLGRLAGRPTLASALDEVLRASLELVGADAGYIRLFNPEDLSPELSRFPFVVSAGISDAYIEYFSALSSPVDDQARRDVFNGRRVIIQDMTTHPSFAPHREVVLAERYRSLQATPLMSQCGSRCVGTICTYFFEPYTPPDSVLDTLDLYAELAANAIEQQRQLAELASHGSTVGAVIARQGVALKHVREGIQSIENGAATLNPEEVRLIARGLGEELQRVTAELDAAAVPPSNLPQPSTDVRAYPYGLTAREMETMMNAWQGLSDKQIARRMGISRYTVAKHVSAGMRKMHVATRTEASVLFEREALYKFVD